MSISVNAASGLLAACVCSVGSGMGDSRKVTGKCGEVAPLARRPEVPGEGGIVGKVWNDFLPT